MDLPGWQAIYEENKDKGFEIISAAQDTGGEEAAGKFFDRAKATYTQIIDETHLISTLYNFVNVPTGVWINEEGIMVRPPEVAYSTTTSLKLGGKTLSTPGDEYVAALRDWIAKGSQSEFVMTPEELSKRLKPRTSDEALAEANFQLATHFQRNGDMEHAEIYWAKAEELNPESWNYHRQDWSFTPKEAGKNWMKKFLDLGDKPYYDPLDMPAPTASD